MRPIQRVISIGFATAALASASLPALSWTVWPDVDFEWYANVGKPVNGSVVEVYPAPREGYIWAPGRYETVGAHQVWKPGRWIRDDFAERVALQVTSETVAGSGEPAQYDAHASVPILYDRYGNPIPVTPDAYPVDSAAAILPADSNRR